MIVESRVYAISSQVELLGYTTTLHTYLRHLTCSSLVSGCAASDNRAQRRDILGRLRQHDTQFLSSPASACRGPINCASKYEDPSSIIRFVKQRRAQVSAPTLGPDWVGGLREDNVPERDNSERLACLRPAAATAGEHPDRGIRGGWLRHDGARPLEPRVPVRPFLGRLSYSWKRSRQANW